MPSRPRSSRVTKPNGNPRGRKAYNDAAHQELEHYTNSNADDPNDIASAMPLTPGVLARPQSSPLSSVGGDVDFRYGWNANSHSTPELKRPGTAAAIAYSKYGDAVKIDSALCKKVAVEMALRDPEQRRPDQRLNIERRSNLEAFLAHMTGRVSPVPCKCCKKGFGPWTECVIYDGQMCGSCTNCWYNASGSRCTFHGNVPVNTANNVSSTPTPHSVVAPVMSPYGSDERASTLPYYTQSNEFEPSQDWDSGRLENEGSQSSQSQQPTLTPAQAPSFASYQAPAPPMQPGLPNMGEVLSGLDVGHWIDPAGRLIHQAMGDVAMLSRRDRHIARIETAAEELGMRIAEYNEYLRTPEGMAEQQHLQDIVERQMIAQGHGHAHTHGHGHGHAPTQRHDALGAASAQESMN